MPPIDPNLRAMEALRLAIERLDQHVSALSAPTMQSYITRQKIGNEEASTTTPTDIQFTSQVGSPPQENRPGETSQDSSSPVDPTAAARERLIAPNERSFMERWKQREDYGGGLKGFLNQTTPIRPAGVVSMDASQSGEGLRERGRRATNGQPGFPDESGLPKTEPSAVIPGMTEGQAENYEGEQEPIPWEGRFQIDALLKIARGRYARKAMQEAAQPDAIPGETSKNASIAGALNYASAMAPELTAAKQLFERHISQPVQQGMSHMIAGQEAGAALGYSPQAGGIGPSHILGIRNPLAALTSEAAQQGIGQKVSSIKASFLGTGISYEQAQGLREGLAGEGFSNQRSGFLGLTTGGQQDEIASALEPAVKDGLRPAVAAGFANTVRFGTSSVKELEEALKGLDITARSLKQTVDQTGEAMQAFAEETEQHGATPIHGLQAYKEIAASTGMAPSITSKILQSPYGQVATAGAGLLPGQVMAQSGVGQSMLVQKTVDMAMKMAPNFKDRYETNAKGERVKTATAEEQKLGFVSEISGIPAQQLKVLTERKDQIEHATTATQKIHEDTDKYHKDMADGETRWMTKHPWSTDQMAYLGKDIKSRKDQLREEQEKGLAGVPASATKVHEEKLAAKEKELAELEKKGRSHGGGLTHLQKVAATKDWTQAAHAAEDAGVDSDEIRTAFKHNKNFGDRFADLQNKVQQKNEIKPEGEEGNIQIEMTALTKKFFKKVGGDDYEQAANAGGKSKASNAASANQNKHPLWEAAERQAQQQVANTTASERKGGV